MSLARLWDRLFGVDGRSLAAFRIGLGALVVADLLTRAPAIAQHYTDGGVLPRDAFARLVALSDWHWSIHLWTGSVAGQAALFLATAVAAGALLLGYRTRTATAVTWLLVVSMQARNPMVLYGADQLLRLLLFWAMFLPLGAVWSIDRRLAGAPLGAPVRHRSAASAVLLLQPCVMYVFAGVLKQNPAWHSGQALVHALSADMYAKPFAQMLSSQPAFLGLLTHVVPWVELLAPALLFVPWATARFRVIGLIVLGAFHVGIALVLTTGLFQPLALVALLPFVPGEAWDRLRAVTGRGHAADRVVTRDRGRVPRRTVAALARDGLVAGLFVYVLVWNVGGLRIDEYSMRHTLSWAREWWAEGRAGVPLSFRDYAVERRLGRAGWIGRVLHLHQRWDMFHRVGPQVRGWPLVIGTTRDGHQISVLEGGRTFEGVAHPRPARPLAFYPSVRWRVYFTYLRTPGVGPARALVAPVVTRDWNERHPERTIETLRIVFVSPDREEPTRREDVWYDGPAVGHE